MATIPTKRGGYPIGQQDFSVLRERGSIYVDKTRFIQKIVESDSQYYFLARPRRFGKSLFLSTLRYFFEGRRELFKGLHIDSIDWDWAQYPVLRLDLNTDRYAEHGKLEGVLDNLFRGWEEKYKVEQVVTDLSQRFNNIIRRAHENTGRKVVILVDEYDKPLVGNLNKNDDFKHYRAQLSSLYSNFKSSAEHIRLVFLTGVSRFSKLSIFSDLNNLNDISFTDAYADICGITEEELKNYFQFGISKLAAEKNVNYDDALKQLKCNYDGYRFAGKGSDIYNPWSLLCAMENSRIGNYWTLTGMPTILAESLKRINAELGEIFNSKCRLDDLKGLDLLNPNPIALLYQTGYLTIKKYNERLDVVNLGIPNAEVKRGLYDFLLPYYAKTSRLSPNRLVLDMVDGFISGSPDEAMQAMQAFFAGIDYQLKIENENNFHNAFFLLTHIIGLDTKTEVHTSNGSIDITIDTDEYLYIIELKYDRSAQAALEQIEQKLYSRPWQREDRKVILIGCCFSSKTRCIEEWTIKAE